MMKDLKEKWDKLFILRLMALKKYNGEDIQLSVAGVVAIDGKSLIYGSKTIIDDILLWYDVKVLTLLYFRYVCEVFKNIVSPFVWISIHF